MTQQLYYTEPETQQFATRVAAMKCADGYPWVALESTAFYPEGGGQPADQGRLAGAGGEWEVVDVQIDNTGTIWHRLQTQATNLPQTGDTVCGELDWKRRCDHTQQHCGQHILSQSFVQKTGCETVSFHLGAEYCSIDLDAAELTTAQVEAAEDLANAVVQAALPIRVVWVDAAGAAAFRLRKAIDRATGIRIVAIGDFDHSGCGGTHPSNSAAVGIIKVIGWEKTRGRVRVTFLCGDRATRDYRMRMAVTQDAALRLGMRWQDVGSGLSMLQAQMEAISDKLAQQIERWAELQAELLVRNAQPLAGSAGQPASVAAPVAPFADTTVSTISAAKPARLVTYCAPAGDGADTLRALAQQIIARAGRTPLVALLYTQDTKPHIVGVRTGTPGKGGPNMTSVLQPLLQQVGGRGGGTPVMAQGGAPNVDAAAVVVEAAVELLRTLPVMQEGW